MDVTIHLTETEAKVLKSIILDVEEWSSYIVKERARLEIDRILQEYIKNCLDNNKPLPSGTKDDIIASIPLQTVYEKNQLIMNTINN
jgi:hypothetical protein